MQPCTVLPSHWTAIVALEWPTRTVPDLLISLATYLTSLVREDVLFHSCHLNSPLSLAYLQNEAHVGQRKWSLLSLTYYAYALHALQNSFLQVLLEV